MKIFIRNLVYWRTKEYAQAEHKNVSQFVEDALVKTLGMEGMDLGQPTAAKRPLDDDAIYGKGSKNE